MFPTQNHQDFLVRVLIAVFCLTFCVSDLGLQLRSDSEEGSDLDAVSVC